MSRRGFTLIELLVVIAIIAILAAILFPVFAKAREKARQASCLSNMKQICLAFMQYSQDYDELMPNTGWAGSEVAIWPDGTASSNPWQMKIYPYIKNVQVFNCPSASMRWKGEPNNGIKYGMNSWMSLVPIGTIVYPSQTLISGDTDGGASYSFCGTAETDRWIIDRHNGGGNFAFADGHAKWFKVRVDTNVPPRGIPFTTADGVYYNANGTG